MTKSYNLLRNHIQTIKLLVMKRFKNMFDYWRCENQIKVKGRSIHTQHQKYKKKQQQHTKTTLKLDTR